MTRKLTALSRRYQAALRQHLNHGAPASAEPAQRLGRQAMATGLETLDLARVHERALIALVLPAHSAKTRGAMVRRAGAFFAEAITPIEKTHRTARESNVRLNQMIATLNRHSADLLESNRQLKQEVAQRKTVEESLRNSERHYSELLEQSRLLQGQLRHLSHQILSAQEERKRISRELHDEIAQTLTGINVRLATLKTDATVNTKDLQKKITSAQRMVERSVDIVHRFARELRPMVLDDLGLIPALHTFMKAFTKQTGLHIHFTTFTSGRIKQLNNSTRTVLYRVAQEALTNIQRHAHASRVEVNLQKLPRAFGLTIKDNGKAFQVARVLHAKKNKRLGLLGMRERVEMVGGRLRVESAPGQGTTIRAEIPYAKGNAGGGGGGKRVAESSLQSKL